MRSDGSQFQDISAGYGSDYLLHWPTPHTLLLASGRQPCGAGHLRTYDIDTSTTYEFWPYFFNDFVVDPSSGQVLIAIPADFADCDIDPQPTGLFSFSPPDYTPESLSPNSFERLELDPSLSGAYLLLGDGHHLHRISPDRQVTPLPDSPPGFPMPSPAGNLWLWDSLSWNDPGIWVGKSGDLTPTRVSTSHAYDLAWFPSGAGFIYIDLDDDAVYIATAPSFEPALLSRGPQLGIDAELDIAAPAH